MPHLSIILGSSRQGRFADQVATWVTSRVDERADVTSEVVDLRDHPLPVFDQAPPAYTGRSYPNAPSERLGRVLDRADGFLILTPEYNHGYPAVLKNAIDHTFVEWNRKPVAFVGWGNVGGARAIEQLRLVAVELELAPLRHAVHILPELMRALHQAETDPQEVFGALDGRLTLLLDELLWWSAALAAARGPRPVAAARPLER
jgi:NAD(P)H-dependent FMN reductase